MEAGAINEWNFRERKDNVYLVVNQRCGREGGKNSAKKVMVVY